MSTTVGALETTVSGHTTSIESLDERVTALEPHDDNPEEPQIDGE